MNVLIIGAGPVGLYLGCLLRQRGMDCTVLEKRTARSMHSRSIGIHPPALRQLEGIGLAKTLVDQGIPVREGHAFVGDDELGMLSFSSLPPPFPFVLVLPQHITEGVLEDVFESLGDPVQRGVTVSGVESSENAIRVHCEGPTGQAMWEGNHVVACDGRRSAIRDLMGIGFSGASYDAHYVMGDFPDTTPFGSRAAIYLGQDGLVESFPLPGSVRRWVARVRQPAEAEKAVPLLLDAVSRRTGFGLNAKDCLMSSSFTAERYEAERFFQGGVALAGDAAHVISPIGGQGMNLGWMDADWLANWFERGAPPPDLDRYDAERRRSFRRAARRSEMNMFMGGAGALLPLRTALARLMLSNSFQPHIARLFSMDRL
ncbi:MAG: NAD(P)/FAD-dependent oxidoreductase [Bacteroidota bacterium]|nr:NAD(P)/FAD-dependent oxidoreductase [Bacteroidota bacterium]